FVNAVSTVGCHDHPRVTDESFGGHGVGARVIRLYTLGRVDLVGPDGGPVRPVLRQPRRVAILAYLALSSPHLRSRDVTQALFWPESDQRRARHSLNQVLHALRLGLGQEAIVSRGAEVGVAADVLWCDAAAFQLAVSAGRPREALDLYRGELLPGVFVKGAPEFERWLESERERLRRTALKAAARLAEEEERRGDLLAASELARRAIELAVDEEIVVQRLMEQLDRLGDRAGAIDVFEKFARHLAAAYGARPSPETQRLASLVRQRLDPVAVAPAPAANERAEHVEADASPGKNAPNEPRHEAPREAPSAVARRRPPRPSPLAAHARRLWLATATVAAVPIALILGGLRGAGEPVRSAPAMPWIVIDPFESAGDRDAEHIAAALTNALVAQLGGIESIHVIPTGLGKDLNSAWGDGAVSRDAGTAAFRVHGAVLRGADRLRVFVQLLEVPSGRTLAAASVERPHGSFFELVDDVSSEVGRLLRGQVGRQLRLEQWRAGAEDSATWELVWRAELEREHAL